MVPKPIKHICFIVNGYPTYGKPYFMTFVDQLIRTIRDLGIDCTVIYPVTHQKINGKPLPPRKWSITTKQGYQIRIYSPRYIFFSPQQIPWGLNKRRIICLLHHLNIFLFERAVLSIFIRFTQMPDIIYGHFARPSVVAARLGEKYQLPSFFAFGESGQGGIKILQIPIVHKWLTNISGIVAVSNSNKKIIVSSLPIREEKIRVFPNGVDIGKFFPGDYTAIRTKLGIGPDDFVIIYVGRFIPKKGLPQLIEATKGMVGVKVICVGTGDLIPEGENIIFNDALPHDKIPDMLSAADIFVLPTQDEGCSNAIVEALACGLPVISSADEFNDEILDETCSLRINPLDIAEIRSAIIKLRDNPERRKQMSAAAREKAKSLDIRIRATNIVNWMEEIIEKHI